MNNEEKILSMLEALTAKVDNLDNAVGTLKQTVGSLEQDAISIRQTTMKIEHEHGQKLTALLDGYKLLYDLSGEIRQDVAGLQSTQEKQDLNIKWLDSQRKAE